METRLHSLSCDSLLRHIVSHIIQPLLTIILWIGIMVVSATNAHGQSSGVDLTVLQSDSQAIVLELTISDYALEEETIGGLLYQLVQIDGLEQALSPAHPQVPSQGTMVGLPTTTGVTVEIIDAGYTDLRGYMLPAAPSYRVVRTGLDGVISGDLVEEAVTEPSWRSDDRLLPAKVVEITNLGYLRGQAVAQLQFYPVQHNPARQELRIYQRLRIRISWPVSVQAAGQSTGQSDPTTQAMLASSLINYPQLVQSSSGSMMAFSAQPELDGLTVAANRAMGAANQRLASIAVTADGFYELSYSALVGAGVSIARLDTLPTAEIGVEQQGKPIPTVVTDVDRDGLFSAGDSIRFYGEELRGPLPDDQPACPRYSDARPDYWYADEQIYWLVQNSDAARIPDLPGSGAPSGAEPASTYPLTRHFEEDIRYWQAMPGQDCGDRWFWQGRLSSVPDATRGIANIHEYPVTVGALPGTQPSATATLTINLRGYTQTDHPFRLGYRKADTTVEVLARDETTLKHQYASNRTLEIDYADLRQMQQLQVEALPIQGTEPPVNQFLVDWFALTLEETYHATNPTYFLFGKSTMAAEVIELSGLAADGVEIYDITVPTQTTRIIDWERLPTGAIRFQSAAGHAEAVTCQGNRYLGRCYLAITPQAQQTTVTVRPYQAPSQTLKSPAREAEYLIITADAFVGEADRLATHRRTTSGFTAEVVTVSQIYDEFNHGTPNPRAIRDFLEYAYHCWNDLGTTDHLDYVALMGDANQDYKNHLGSGPTNYVPSFSFESTLFGEISSDNWFVSIATNVDDIVGPADGSSSSQQSRLRDWCDNPTPVDAERDALPDLFLGRIPAADVLMAQTYVNKVIAYEALSFETPWLRNAYFIADDEKKFETSVTQLRSTITPLYNTTVMTIPNGLTSESPDAKGLEIVEELYAGKLLVSYIGHGDFDAWGRWDAGNIFEEHYIFHKDYLTRKPNQEKLPMVIVGNCLNGFFAGPTIESSFAEAFLFSPDGGAIAVWAPTGLGLPSGHRVLLGEFYKTLFYGTGAKQGYNAQNIGVAAQSAMLKTFKANSYWQELVWTYVMFGDPALHMPISTNLYLPLVAKD